MTYPAITSSSSEATSNSASLAVTMPASIAAGDWLVAHICTSGSPYIKAPGDSGSEWAGWTAVGTARDGATGCRHWVYYKSASGSETTITCNVYTAADFLTAASVRIAATVFRVTGVSATAPNFATSVSATSTTPNPGSVTGWTGEETAYLAFYGGATVLTESATPTGSTPIVAANNAGTGTTVTVGSVYINSTAGSVDFDAWTVSASVANTAYAVAFRPAASSSIAPLAAYYAMLRQN